MVGVSKQLQVGQTAQFQASETGIYQITLVPAEQPGQKIVDVGVDYVVFEDEQAEVKTRVPFHLIKSVDLFVPTAQETQPLAA